jgi:hypothetical protein
MNNFRLKVEFWIVLPVVLFLAAILATLDGSGHWLQAWIAYSIMLAIGALSIFGLWKAIELSWVTRIA